MKQDESLKPGVGMAIATLEWVAVFSVVAFAFLVAAYELGKVLLP